MPEPVPLSADEAGSVAQLRAAIGLDNEPPASAKRRFCTDQCLARYLRARSWDVAKAKSMLEATLLWRAEAKVDGLRFDTVAAEAQTGKMYRLRPRDKQGRPVLTMRPGRENTSGHEGQIQFLTYSVETMARSTAAPWDGPPRGAGADLAPEQLTLFLDFTDYSVFNAPPWKTSLETLNILQDHFPERLGQAVCLNPPTLFSMFWKMIKPFLDARTVAKVKFLYADNPQKSQQILLDVFESVGELEQSLGGDSPHEYDFEKYRALMKAEEEELLARREAYANGTGPACP